MGMGVVWGSPSKKLLVFKEGGTYVYGNDVEVRALF